MRRKYQTPLSNIIRLDVPLRTLIFLVLFLGTNFISLAQEKYTFSGTVKSKTDGESLIGVAVHIKERNIGTLTNSYGFFSLTLPKGQYDISVDYLGYEDLLIDLVLDKNIQQTIELAEISEKLDEVIITGKSSAVENTEIGVSKLTSLQIKKLPALLGEADIQQAIITMPGITSVGELSNGFNVRGGKVDHNLILVDEAMLFNSSHLFGLISVVNADAIKDVKVMKAGIPARYGGRAGSVVDIFLNSGNNKNFRVQGGISPLCTRLSLEIPIVKEKLNIYLSGRRSFADLIVPVVDGDIGAPGFYDATSKITYHLNPNNSFYLSGYFGRDIIKSELEGDKFRFSWGNTTASFRWNHVFNNKVFSNLTLLSGNYGFKFESNSGGLFDDDDSTAQGDTDYGNGIKNKSFKYDVSIFPNADAEINAGFGSTFYKFNTGKSNLDVVKINNDKSIVEYFIYFEGQFKPLKNLSLSEGIRLNGVSYYGPAFGYEYDPNVPKSSTTIVNVKRYKANEVIKSYLNFEPRIAMNYQIHKNVSVKLAYDKLAQNIHLLSNSYSSLPFDAWSPSTESIEPTITNQYTLGSAFDKGGFSAEMGIYYKQMKNILVFRNGVDLFLTDYIETRTVPSNGHSYGVELSVSKNTGRVTGQLNYTFSRVFLKTVSPFEEIQIDHGKYFPADYDRPHVLNINANWSISKRVTLSGQFLFQSGRPVTLPVGHFGGTPTYSTRNGKRIPATHRLDLAVNFYPKVKNLNRKWKGYWTVSLINVYGRKNPYSYFVVSKKHETVSGVNNSRDLIDLRLKKLSVFGSIIPSITYNFSIF